MDYQRGLGRHPNETTSGSFAKTRSSARGPVLCRSGCVPRTDRSDSAPLFPFRPSDPLLSFFARHLFLNGAAPSPGRLAHSTGLSGVLSFRRKAIGDEKTPRNFGANEETPRNFRSISKSLGLFSSSFLSLFSSLKFRKGWGRGWRRGLLGLQKKKVSLCGDEAWSRASR
jgi:hypothetical protein